MEKSIESIWKQGFLDNDAMVAPKLNNLYNQKSIHIIDKIIKMMKINLIALVVSSFVFLVVFYYSKIPIAGVLMFILTNAIVIINRNLFKSLKSIDKNKNSYQYLKSFDEWMKLQISINKKMSHYTYPCIFIAMVLGFLFSQHFQNTLNKILGNHEVFYFYGIPVFWVLTIVSIVILLAVFGGRLYLWELNLVYGRVLKKLKELITDMEDLRN